MAKKPEERKIEIITQTIREQSEVPIISDTQMPTYLNLFGQPEVITLECPYCDGECWIYPIFTGEKARCPGCNAAGYVKVLVHLKNETVLFKSDQLNDRITTLRAIGRNSRGVRMIVPLVRQGKINPSVVR